MYKEIFDFVKARKLPFPEKNKIERKICGYIVLDENNEYVRIEKLDAPAVKLVPDIKNAATANVLCEKVSYVFNRTDAEFIKNEKDVDKIEKKHGLWLEHMLSGNDMCASLKAVYDFVYAYEYSPDFHEKVMEDLNNSGLKNDNFVSFMINGECIEDMDDWEPWFADKLEEPNEETITSLLSGETQTICPLQNVTKAKLFGKSFAITSVGNNSYESYGFDQTENCHIGIDDVNRLAAFFNFVNNNDDYSNRDLQVVFFYNREIENIISKSLKGEIDLGEEYEDLQDDIAEHRSLISNMLKSIRTGTVFTLPEEDRDAKYYMYHVTLTGMSSNARFCLEERKGSYADLSSHLMDWYRDTSLVEYGRANPIKKIYPILMSCSSASRNKSASLKNIYDSAEKEFSGMQMELLDSVYEGKQLPYILYRNALDNVAMSLTTGVGLESDIWSKNSKDAKSSSVKRNIWLRIIKCFLIRKGYNIMPELSNSPVSPAYAFGRLFATFEQEQAIYHNNEPSKKNLLSQKFFNVAMETPAYIFPDLVSLSQVYMTKVVGRLAEKFELLHGELVSQIDGCLPKTFDIYEQGAFAMGYYQQKTAFIREMKEAKRAKEEKALAEKASSETKETVDEQ